MKDKILVNAVKDHAFECDTNIIGRAGEGGTAQFEITLSKKMTDRTVYLDFEKPNGETYRTDPLTVTSNVAVYDVPVYLLSESGEIKVQLVLIDSDGGVWKSEVKRFANLESINATTSIPIPVFPVGTANITANGTYDITHYARVKVNVALDNLDPELTAIEKKLADLNAILDELGGSNEGKFYIDSTEYTFAFGMTWEGFIDSSYNDESVWLDEEGTVSTSNGIVAEHLDEEYDVQHDDDTIISGCHYVTIV